MDILIETNVDPSWGDEQFLSVFVTLCAYINKRRVRPVNSNFIYVNKWTGSRTKWQVFLTV